MSLFQKFLLFSVFWVNLLFFCGCGSIAQSLSETSTEYSPANFTQTAGSLNTPEKVFTWLTTFIQYRADQTPEDEFRPAEKTFALGYGDCDDYAVFAATVLSQHGYNTKVLAVYSASLVHAVCVWEENGSYNYLSNLGLRRISAQNLEQLAADISSSWISYQIYTQS